jgi:hypothetical protein
MKVFLTALICLVLGAGLGWYIGYTRPEQQNQRKLLRELQANKDSFHQTEQQDEFAAALACTAFRRLEAGNTERAKYELLTTISIYYRAHRFDGNSNLIVGTEAYASTNAALSNAIYRKLE